MLRNVLRTKPHLRKCLNRCRHCRIFFISDHRNAKRIDLRCPFGCREAHSKQCSIQRSVEYYRTEKGKKRKQFQNNKRRSSATPSASATPSDTPPDLPSDSPKASEQNVSPTHHQPDHYNELMVEHVRMVTSLIEGRWVSSEEILEMLAKVLRQHSMDHPRKVDYVVWKLNQVPP